MYNPEALQALDYVLTEARQFGIRVIVVLTDNWRYLNGVDQYVDWSKTVPKRDRERQTINFEDFVGQVSIFERLHFHSSENSTS